MSAVKEAGQITPNVATHAPPVSIGGRSLIGGARFTLWVLLGINLLNFFDRQIASALAEPIRKDFHLSDTALGMLGTAFTLVYAVAGLPLGYLSDRWSRTRVLAIGTALWSLLTAGSGIARTYTQMIITRLGIGLGEAACAPAGQSLIADLFPPQQRSRAMGVFMLGVPVGSFLAYSVAGALGTLWGWRPVFLLAGLPGLALAIIASRIPESSRAGVPRIVSRGDVIALLKVPTLWWIILSGVFHNFNMYAINIFQTPFLQRFHGMTLAAANNISAISLGGVGVIGLLLGGWLSDATSTADRSRRLLVGACSMAAAAPCVLLALSQPRGATQGFLIFMTLGSITMYVYYSTVYAAIQDIVAPELRATAVATYFCAMYLLGGSLGPVGVGMLSDYFAHRAMYASGATTLTEPLKAVGLHNAMYATPILIVLTSLTLFTAWRSMKTDLHRRHTADPSERR